MINDLSYTDLLSMEDKFHKYAYFSPNLTLKQQHDIMKAYKMICARRKLVEKTVWAELNGYTIHHTADDILVSNKDDSPVDIPNSIFDIV